MKDKEYKQALPMGYELRGYRLREVLGVGGFGVTYLATHTTLGHSVAIKEYLPNEFALREDTTVYPKSEADREDFNWGLTRFLDEAKTLAKFKHRNLVRVRDYFEANSTAYIVMDYEEGESLDRLLAEHGTLTQSQLRNVLLPIVEGLREVHEAGFLHRDIKPSNIFIRRSDESPVLLDFGAARQALGRKSKSLTAVASAGYSPPEQYESEGEQGPWTDIYALSALCYRAITGQAPIEAPRRLNRIAQGQPDPLKQLAGDAAEGYSAAFLVAVDHGLQVIVANRPANLDEWVAQLAGVSAMLQPGDGRRKTGSSETYYPRRGRAWGLAVGVVALVAAVSAGIYLWTASESTQLPDADSGQPVSPGSPLDATDDAVPSPSLREPEPALAQVEQGLPSIPESQRLFGGAAILVVETEPSGAEVRIGDQVLGHTPLERDDMQAGTYSVTLEHPEYQTVRVDRQGLADNRALRIERVLVPGVGALTVRTRPRDVWIERDGERLAEGTPVTLEGLPAGLVALTLGAAEHRTIRVEADVPKDGVGMLERTLERIPYGTLTLELKPSDATVTLPEIGPSYRPGMRLLEGIYRVVVSRAGYQEAAREVRIAGDTTERIELIIDPQPFTVDVTPSGAVIAIENITGPYRAGMLLEPGEYRIRVSASGYEAQEETVTHGTEATSLHVSLVRAAEAFFTDHLASGGEGPEMVVIPAGWFRMGCVSGIECFDDEKPVHEVRIKSFALSKHEVTFANWNVCVSSGGCQGYHPDDEGWGRGNRPVIKVSWDDASSYAQWLSEETGSNYRLPSEAEWEYAARAGSQTKYSWGNEIGRNRANCDGCGSRWDHQQTAPVGSFSANALGLYDMHGNVREWVEDCWNDSYLGAPSNGSAWLWGICSRRGLRGGSWIILPGYLRSANRDRDSTGVRVSYIGFRVARTLTP